MSKQSWQRWRPKGFGLIAYRSSAKRRDLVARLECLERRDLLAAEPIISEFLAGNDSGIVDADRWRFPAVDLEPGGYLLVFASEKDRAVAGSELHTNFRLAGEGEYLALVKPDGVTVAQAFVPEYPRQVDDISYGIGQEVTTLIDVGADAHYLVPADDALGDTWRETDFEDSTWAHGPTGLGYEVGDVQGTAVAYSNQAGAVGSQDYGGSLGLDFAVESTITVTKLGVFDSGADGLARTIVAQMWTRTGNTGTKLAELTFTPASSGELRDGDRFKSLASPLILAPGDYTIVAYGYGAGEPNGNLNGPDYSQKTQNDGNGVLTFLGGGRYGDAGQFPNTPDGGPENRYSAGTFAFRAPAYEGLIATDVADEMLGVNASLYSRQEFTIDDPAQFASLALRLRYNDGFAAYLNGELVATRNAPEARTWNSAATEARGVDDSLAVEEINLTSHLGALRAGTNVLAIHALNVSAGDDQFLLVPELVGVGQPNATYVYLEQPTPGGPNSLDAAFAGLVEEVSFSVEHGFFDAAFPVTLATPTPGATIRYTTDGSTPSATNGATYTGSIEITGTTTLRATATRSDWRDAPSMTQSYFFLDDVLEQPAQPAGYPSNWNGAAADYGMSQRAADLPLIAGDPTFSIDEANAIIKQSLQTLPSVSIVMNADDLFSAADGIYANPTQRGSGWERAASIEYLLPEGTEGFQINGGLRMMGFTSRSPSLTPKHSLRLVFKGEYGPGTLNYPLFDDTDVTTFNTLALRGNARDTWLHDNGASVRADASYLRDQWAKEAQRDMGQLATSGRFVHVYLNGLYWGVYNLTERPDDVFASQHLGGLPEEYDVVTFCCPDRAADGTIAKWDELLGLANAGLASDAAYQRLLGNHPDGTRNPAYEVLIDIDNFIDFVINGQYHASLDWPGNYYVLRQRGPDSTGFKFLTWDNDLAMPYGDVNRNKTVSDNNQWWTQSPGVLDIALRANADYRMRFADRVQTQFFHDGALTPEASAERWQNIVAELDGALIAESARWGDYRRDVAPAGDRTLYTQEQHWRPAVEELTETYFPGRTAVVLQQMRAVGLYPMTDAPVFSQYGGDVELGFSLTLGARDPIFYTLDGSDPRLPGGGLNPAAISYAGPITIDESLRVSARVRSARGGWSALESAVFVVDGGSKLRVTELMYHPRDPQLGSPYVDNDFEYLELTNIGDAPLDLAGTRFSRGVEFAFAASPPQPLPPGKSVLLVANQAAFESRYGTSLPVVGSYTGRLDNAGERVTLLDRFGGAILDFTYDDGWQPTTDGDGFSLVIVDAALPAATWNEATSWRASLVVDGSPGRDDVPVLQGDTDEDGDVDLEDLNNVRNYFGYVGTEFPGDATGDGVVDLDDLNAVRNNFGATLPGALVRQREVLPLNAGREREIAHALNDSPLHLPRDHRVDDLVFGIDGALNERSFPRMNRRWRRP